MKIAKPEEYELGLVMFFKIYTIMTILMALFAIFSIVTLILIDGPDMTYIIILITYTVTFLILLSPIIAYYGFFKVKGMSIENDTLIVKHAFRTKKIPVKEIKSAVLDNFTLTFNPGPDRLYFTKEYLFKNKESFRKTVENVRKWSKQYGFKASLD
jgi:hypothetical protein